MLGIELVEDIIRLEINFCRVSDLVVHRKIDNPVVIRRECPTHRSRTTDHTTCKERRIEVTVAVVHTDVPLIPWQITVDIYVTLCRLSNMCLCISEACAQVGINALCELQ